MFGFSTRDKLDRLKKQRDLERERTKTFIEEQAINDEIRQLREQRGGSQFERIGKMVTNDIKGFAGNFSPPPIKSNDEPLVPPSPPPHLRNDEPQKKKVRYCYSCGQEIKEERRMVI